jgi:hypothetical protein
MDAKFEFVSAFLCERVIQDKQDDVLTAIRLVDAFLVPEDRPSNFAIQFWLVCSFKSLSPIDPEGYSIGLTLIRATGEREYLGKMTDSMHPQILPESASALWGVGIVTQLSVLVRNLGTGYIEVAVNEKPAAKVPFTIRQIPTPQADSK